MRLRGSVLKKSTFGIYELSSHNSLLLEHSMSAKLPIASGPALLL